jgi:hypothetical protein
MLALAFLAFVFSFVCVWFFASSGIGKQDNGAATMEV